MSPCLRPVFPWHLSNQRDCARRSHGSEYEISRLELHLLQLQQSRSGRRRRRGFGWAQPSGGHGGEAAHRGIPGVGRLPAPLGGRAGEPDPAAELSLSRNPLTAHPSLHGVTHLRADVHTKTQMCASDTAAHSGSCRYGTFTYSRLRLWVRTGPEHITADKCLVMHLVHFDLTVPCYL